MQRTLLAISACAIIGACARSSAPATPATPSCASGKACFEIGAATYDGADPVAGATNEDLVRATRYFIRACELGYDRGCHSAGNMYRLGMGVEKDLVRARQYFESVCDEATYPEACHNMGLVDRELRDAGQAPPQQ